MDNYNWTDKDFEEVEQAIAEGEYTWRDLVGLNAIIAEGVLRRLIRRLSKTTLGRMDRIVHIWRMKRGEAPEVEVKRVSHDGGSWADLDYNLKVAKTPTVEEQAEERRKAKRLKDRDRQVDPFEQDGGRRRIGRKNE